MQILIATLIFLTAVIYAFVVSSFALTPIALLKGLILPMVLLLLLLYRSSITSWRKFLAKRGKWFLLFWGTVFIELLVLSTGGLQSPFLILIHLFMVGLSFVFSFSISVLFLVLSFAVILGEIIVTQDFIKYISEHPQSIILQFASLIPIVAVAYIISQQYRLKDMLSSMLGMKVKTDEAILEHVNELIIITDPQLNILSVNDAVERALQRSRSELLNKELFSSILVKTTDGKLVNKDYFFPDGQTFDQSKKYLAECEVVNASGGNKKFAMLLQPIEDAENRISQISFVLSYSQQIASDTIDLDVSIERSRAKYEAMLEMLKNKLLKGDNSDAASQLILIKNIESDLFAIQTLKTETKREFSRIDIAKLCKETVQLEQDFAKIFQVPVTFELQNFGWKDVAPLTVKNYAVTPEELTGPFFTVECDVQKVGLLIKKLLDVVVMLASSETKGQVHVSVEPKENEVELKIFSNCPNGLDIEVKDLYAPYYSGLATKTNLQSGSGLEGYLINALSKSLEIDIAMQYNATPSANIVFTVKLPKKFSTQNTSVPNVS